jgi:hypothetical protein
MANPVKRPGTTKSELESMPERSFDKWVFSEMDLCQCPDCTTFNECAKNSGERLYCVVTRSPFCIEKKKGCLCLDCPVAQELGFEKTYHCLNGAEISRGRK